MKLKVKLTNLPPLNITHRIEEIANGVWFVMGILDDEWNFRATIHTPHIRFTEDNMVGTSFIVTYGGKGDGILEVFITEPNVYFVEMNGGDGVFSFIVLSRRAKINMMNVKRSDLETYLPCEVIDESR